MFTTVVVGTDWSGTAEVAFVKALELARAGGGRLHVVTASPQSPPPASGRSAAASGSRSLGPDFQADVVLERTLDRLGASDVEVRQHTVTGELYAAVVLTS
jgi:nucleotide-binding universal stress UspA family protein